MDLHPFDADPDPDPDPTPSFTYGGKSDFLKLLFKQCLSLSRQRHIGVIIFNIFDNISKFYGKSIV